MYIKQSIFAGTLIVFSVVFASGCSNGHHMNDVRFDSDESTEFERALDTVVILGTSLQFKDHADSQWKSAIGVESTNSRRSPNDTLEAWAVFRNQINETLQLEVRTSFFDELSSPIGPPSSWTRLFLSENATQNYSETSLNYNAFYYLIEVREAH